MGKKIKINKKTKNVDYIDPYKEVNLLNIDEKYIKDKIKKIQEQNKKRIREAKKLEEQKKLEKEKIIEEEKKSIQTRNITQRMISLKEIQKKQPKMNQFLKKDINVKSILVSLTLQYSVMMREKN